MGSAPGVLTLTALPGTNDLVSPHLFPNISTLHEALSTDDPSRDSALY